MKKDCLTCNKEFLSYPSLDRKFCSFECYWVAMRNGKYHNGFKKGHRDFISQEIRKKQREKIINQYQQGKRISVFKGKKEEKSFSWKGNNVGYRGLHIWLENILGKPTRCEKCGKDGLTGRQIHWANRDHKYRRVAEDFIRLCTKCHGEYDKINKLKKFVCQKLYATTTKSSPK